MSNQSYVGMPSQIQATAPRSGMAVAIATLIDELTSAGVEAAEFRDAWTSLGVVVWAMIEAKRKP
jgi:hypothetical protein